MVDSSLTVLVQEISDRFHDTTVLPDDIAKGIADAGIGPALVMHREAEVHGTIQIGRGFGLAQGATLDSVGLIDHAVIIGTRSGDLGSDGDTLPTVHQRFSMIQSAAPILNKESS